MRIALNRAGLSLNAGGFTVERLDKGLDDAADRIEVAGGGIGVMGVKAFEALTLVAANTTLGHWRGPGRDEGVTFVGVAPMGLRQLCVKPGVGAYERGETCNASSRLETSHPLVGQGTGKPVPGWERCAIIEDRRYCDHHRQLEMTAGHNLYLGPQGAVNLAGNDELVVHPPSRPVKKSTIASNQLPDLPAASGCAAGSGSAGTTM